MEHLSRLPDYHNMVATSTPPGRIRSGITLSYLKANPLDQAEVGRWVDFHRGQPLMMETASQATPTTVDARTQMDEEPAPPPPPPLPPPPPVVQVTELVEGVNFHLEVDAPATKDNNPPK